MSLHAYEVLVFQKGSVAVVLDCRVNLRGMRLLLDKLSEFTHTERTDILQSLVDNDQVLATCEKTQWVFSATRIPERH